MGDDKDKGHPGPQDPNWGEGGHAAGKGSESNRDPQERGTGAEGQVADVPDADAPELADPAQTPLFHAQHAERYARQTLIREYEQRFDCRFIVMLDAIFAPSVTYLEELIWDADPAQDLHLMLDSPGGDGETAIRLVRAAQSRCRELTVIVPNQAKSAATILVMGADHVLMGPTSDLGPVDPQFPQPNSPNLVAAKDLIRAVESAEGAIAANPDTYPLYASLLADVTAVMVQQARSALERTGDLVMEALMSNRTEEQAKEIAAAITHQLVDLPREHGAVFGARDAKKVGLPVIEADPKGIQWRMIWRLWTKYFAHGTAIYEGRMASQVINYASG